MDLIIVVAGGHGKCCLDIAREVYDDIVFLDDGLVGKTINDCKVIGGMKDIQVLREKIFKYLYCYWQQQASRRTHNTSTRNRI